MMLVTSVEFAGKKLVNKGNAVVAVVLFHAESGILQLSCKAPVHEGESEVSQYAALVSDAIRQIGRMPEYLTGKQSLRFAPDALSPRKLRAA
ncbi:hypothetical protein [Shimia biformata]|uniref:hypothetical protein n=1 Tax=Shimia biformata TaxID=1294299 RepID=UPI00194FF9D2|nr:hypothetical protein [Shimia biformata]